MFYKVFLYNLFLKINQFKQLLLKYNEPLLHILPLTEYEIKVKNHLIDDKEFYGMIADMSFNNNYRIRKKVMKSKEKKCPFH